jgi:hypothetical protein
MLGPSCRQRRPDRDLSAAAEQSFAHASLDRAVISAPLKRHALWRVPTSNHFSPQRRRPREDPEVLAGTGGARPLRPPSARSVCGAKPRGYSRQRPGWRKGGRCEEAEAIPRLRRGNRCGGERPARRIALALVVTPGEIVPVCCRSKSQSSARDCRSVRTATAGRQAKRIKADNLNIRRRLVDLLLGGDYGSRRDIALGDCGSGNPTARAAAQRVWHR